MTTVLSWLVGCVATWEPPDGMCTEAAPCAPVLADGQAPAQATVLVANVFDAPLFDAWVVLPGESGIRRVLSPDPERWGAPSEIVVGGDHPAAMFDATRGSWRLCRRQAGEVRCASSFDGAAWHDSERVWPPDDVVRPRWPLALVDFAGEPVLFVLADGRDGTGLYRARHDGGEAFVLDPVAILTTDGAVVATVAVDEAGARLLVVDGDTVGAWRSVDGEVWHEEDADAGVAGTTWLAAETWFGERWVWGS